MNKPAPFTMSQKAFYDRSFTSWFNIAEGGKRGGKNVLTTLAFCRRLETHPNRLHLVAGVSIAAAKLNILDCDGFGMLNYFSGRCREGEYKNRDCLYIQTATGEKVVLISGGGKDGDQKLIQGNTYGMGYVTEANLCHQNFIQEVFDRTLSSEDRAVFHDLNPKAPGHWYYKDVLSFHEKQQKENPLYGFNYGHFTIADNMSVPNDRLKRIIGTYDKQSVWYRRDILGERIAPEGLVYRMFSEDQERFLLRGSTLGIDGQFYISGDYGTVNPMSMGLWCVRGKQAIRVKEYYHDSRATGKQLTDEEYYTALEELAQGYYIRKAIFDPSAASFITTIRRHGRFSVQPAENDVLNGIRVTATLLNSGMLKIHESCKDTIREFGLYLWDEKKHDDAVIKENDHAMDDIRYFCATVLAREFRWVDWR